MARFLCVNPYIEDFAAYDLWLRPLGLLMLAEALQRSGHDIQFIDCLDRFHPHYSAADTHGYRSYHRGKYLKTPIEKPSVLSPMQRYFYRFGISEEHFHTHCHEMPMPDYILITSMMTYWYTGVRYTINLLREQFPGVPIFLGGRYVFLNPQHAERYAGADAIIQSITINRTLHELSRLTDGIVHDRGNAIDYPPAYTVYPVMPAVALLTSLGCPFTCNYCATPVCMPEFSFRNHDAVIAEIHTYMKNNVTDIALYDDALLYQAEKHFIPLFSEIAAIRTTLSFHTPNGLHCRYITAEVAKLMYKSGFKTIRLSLETADYSLQRATGGKVTNTNFITAIENLNAAGFQRNTIETYLMTGLPEQTVQQVLSSIRFAHQQGVIVRLAEYSPIPRTPLFVHAPKAVRDEPLLQNNLVYSTLFSPFTAEQQKIIKHEARHGNAINRSR